MRYIRRAFWVCFSFLLTGCAVVTAPSPLADNPKDEPMVEKEAEYKSISAEDAHAMMNTEHILLDVRTEEEFRENRIDGAILIPDYEIGERAEDELTDKNAVILVYCRSGRRSALVAKELVSMGYMNVYDFGGIIDWPYDTVRN